jgi:crotonobetainyl-CoA:carnitine CoA-transferase CaiB-like acyl-CoA transferase
MLLGHYQALDGRWVAVAVRGPADVAAAAALLGVPPALDRLRPAMSSYAEGREASAAMDQLLAAGVPAAAVQDIGEVFADPQFAARGLFRFVDQPGFGEIAVAALPWNLERTPPEIRGPAPALGAHTKGVLANLAGVDDAEFEALVAGGVVELAPPAR